MDSVIHVTTRELVALKRFGGLLNHLPGQVKAKQGGQYLSEQKGRGMEYAESRPYESGDDIRNLDWRVMARTGKAHTKLFREEHERPVFFLMDFRSSMFFATRGMFKSALSARIAAILAWNAHNLGDRVGGIFLNEIQHQELKPRRGKSAVLHFINALVSYAAQSSGKNSDNANQLFRQSLMRMRRLVKPGSLVFIFSDFRNFDFHCQQQLMQLARHNQIQLYQIYDVLERELPSSGHYTLCDQNRYFQLNSNDKSLLQKYQQQFQKNLDDIQSVSRKGQMGLQSIRTDTEPLHAVTGVKI